MRLGTLLLRDAVISLSQLEAALRAQVLYGGKLGTNLVELDVIDLQTLGQYLTRITDCPLAETELFEHADLQLVQSFGPELAELYTAFPLRFEPDDPSKMAVAFAQPRDERAVADIANICDCAIAPYVAPELRIYYYLEKHYGLTRKARYLRMGTRKSSPGSTDDRRRSQPAGGLQMPPEVRFEPKRRRTASVPPESSAPTRFEPVISYRDAGDAIDLAASRNEIAGALMDYAVGRFEVAVLFLPRDHNAIGWRMHSAVPGATVKIEELTLPLGGTSALQAALDRARPFRGPSPSAGRPIETQLWRALGVTSEPTDLLVVPVLVKQRVVNLVYAHGFAGEPPQDHLCDELVELARKAGDAYLRLIQAAKQHDD
jgi:hypothetical protein